MVISRGPRGGREYPLLQGETVCFEMLFHHLLLKDMIYQGEEWYFIRKNLDCVSHRRTCILSTLYTA